MNFITLLLSCHCSNECYEECNMAVVHIDRSLLAQIKQRRAIAGVVHAQDDDLVDSYFWTDADFVNIDDDALAQLKRTARLVVENFVVLDGKTKLPSLDAVRTDCVQMRVGVDGYIRWTAYDHLSSDELTTENVTIADLNDLFHPGKKHKKGGA